MGPRPDVSLTRWLVLLVLGVLIPLLLLGGIGIYRVSRDTQSARELGQTDATRALALAVEGEVRSWRAALSALAASASLRSARWAEFDTEARQVAARYGGWVAVDPARGPQLLNTLRPFGAPLPAASAPEPVRRVFRDGKPLTEMVTDALAQRFVISNATPVFRGGEAVYCLTLNFGPERLSRLLQDQQLPAGWLASIGDQQRRLVARSRDAERWIGKPAPEWPAAATWQGESGMVAGPGGQTAFRRLERAPWVVALTVPAAVLPGGPIWGFILAGVLLGLAAVGLAVHMGRKVAIPVRELARRSERLLQGQEGELGPGSGIREVQELRQALTRAAAAAREHAAERERAAAALAQANRALEARVRERTAALEAALAEAEESRRLLVALMDTIPEGIAIADGPPDYRFKLISRHGLAVSQRPLSSLEGVPSGYEQTRWNLRLADGVTAPTPEQTPLYRAARLGETVRDCEMVLYTADGRRLEVLVDAMPIRDAQGTIVGAIQCWRDITERKRTEEALRRYELLASHSRDIILFMRREDGRILEANAAAVAAYGYSREELLTRSIRDLRATDTHSLLAEEMARADAHGLLFETRHRRKDGSSFPVEVSSRGATIGETRTLVSVIRDIGRRKQAEAEIQSLARFPGEDPQPVVRLSPEGLLLYANPASAELLKAWGRGMGERAPDPWPEVVGEALGRAGRPVVELQCGGRDYACFVAPVPELGYVNLYARDVTEQKRAEAALRRLNADLEARVAARTAELSQAIQTLERQAAQLRGLAAELTLAEERERRRLADLLHDELQQLLVATRLRVHMLGRAGDPALREGAGEVVGLIGEALAVTRTLTGELQPPALQRGALLPALEWLARWMAEKHRLAVRLQPPAEPLPPLPEELAVLLYRAVRELLLNAVKHAQAAEAVVSVTREGEALAVAVADAGVGFDPGRLRVAGGSEGGYGLLGIRERLEWVGGRLELDSAPGRGSRFGLVVPLGPPPLASPATRPVRILLADDHVLVRQGLATLLAGAPDLQVVGEAADGEQAVEATRRLAPDVVLMDVSMPRLNGVDATRRIRAEWPAVRVIGLSVDETPLQAEAMRQAGATAYLGKDAPAEILLAAIRKAAG